MVCVESSICSSFTYLSYEDADIDIQKLYANISNENRNLFVCVRNIYIPNFSGYLPLVSAKYCFISSNSLSMSPEG